LSRLFEKADFVFFTRIQCGKNIPAQVEIPQIILKRVLSIPKTGVFNQIFISKILL
jgi:hypothetical protein